MPDEPDPVGTEPAAERPAPHAPRRRKLLRHVLSAFVAVVIAWLILAYVILPMAWRHYEHHPAMEDAPKVTVTGLGIPGDPLNVGLIGTESELVQAMTSAGWDPADPVTLETSLRIAGSVLRDRPYPDAPVSSLFVFGRKQDLAYEKPVGKSADRRHHVRFWKSDKLGAAGVPLWIGAVTFDRGVGLSHRTGQITHHISPDVDAERDALMSELSAAGWLTKLYQVTGVGATLFGRNGGGDRYVTDGELSIGVLAAKAHPDAAPNTLANPAAVQIKQQLWSAIRSILQDDPGP